MTIKRYIESKKPIEASSFQKVEIKSVEEKKIEPIKHIDLYDKHARSKGATVSTMASTMNSDDHRDQRLGIKSPF